MAQLRRNEKRRDAALPSQLQSALHEGHGQVGIVLVAPRAGRPEPVVALGEALAERAGQCLAPYPGRIADDDVEPAGGHDVGEMHGVVESGQAAVTREPAPGRTQLAQFLPDTGEFRLFLASQATPIPEQCHAPRLLQEVGDPRLRDLDGLHQ